MLAFSLAAWDAGVARAVTFAAPSGSPFSAGSHPQSVAIGSFNSGVDPFADLAVANRGSDDVSILFGNGSGGFTAPTNLSVGSGCSSTTPCNPVSVAVGNLNPNVDSHLDVVAANEGTNDVAVLLGDGSGGFTGPSNFSIDPAGCPLGRPCLPTSVAVGSFNSSVDAYSDLVITYLNGNVAVLLGDGNGGFSPAANSPFNAGASPISVAVGDFNLDSIADLAVANQSTYNVVVLLGDGTGNFSSAGPPPFAGTCPNSIAVGEFDGAYADLAVADGGCGFVGVTILLGDGTGNFPAGSTFSAGTSPSSVAVGDFDGDALADLALADRNSNDVLVLIGNGMGGFAADTNSPFSAGTSPRSVAVGDFNLDSAPDLAVANDTSPGTVSILLNTTPPTRADLAASKSDSPDPVLAGQTLTYTVGVTNAGPDGASDVTMTDTLPASVIFQSATPSQGAACTRPTSTVVRCDLGDLASGGDATVTIKVEPELAGTITNSATVTSGVRDPNPADNAATASTTVNPAADLALTKSDSPDPAHVGQQLSYTLSVKNNGPQAATGVTVRDALPKATGYGSASASQGSCTRSKTTVTCSLGNLAGGETATITIVVKPVQKGTVTNTASVSASSPADPESGNDAATATTTVKP
jgi:uncharacterized repeat protein (TIGR01451 family)